MNEGTRFGTTMHSRKIVQEPDAYGRATDGKIKRTFVRGSLRSQEVVCTLFLQRVTELCKVKGCRSLHFLLYFQC